MSILRLKSIIGIFQTKLFRKYALFLAIIFSLHFNSTGQVVFEKSYPYYINGMYTSGHIGEHSKDVSNISRGFTQGFDMLFSNLIFVNTKMNDRKQSVFLDMGLHYVKYPYDFLGESFGITLGRSGRILEFKKFQLFGQYTQGVGFYTKPYTQINNKNTAISTNLGFVAHANIAAIYPIYKNWNALAAVGFNHISNGSIKRPNLGLNVFSTNIGLAYHVKDKTIAVPEDFKYSTRKYFYHLIGTYFRTSNSSYDGETYPAYNFHVQIEKNLSIHHSLLLSFDYTKDLKTLYPEPQRPEGSNDNDYNFLGISAGGNWKYSIIDFDVTTGAYLVRPWHQTTLQYTIIHFKIYAFKNKFFLVGLKAHKFQADVFEMGIGIKL